MDYSCRHKLTYDKLVAEEGLLINWGQGRAAGVADQVMRSLDKGGLSWGLVYGPANSLRHGVACWAVVASLSLCRDGRIAG